MVLSRIIVDLYPTETPPPPQPLRIDKKVVGKHFRPHRTNVKYSYYENLYFPWLL